MRGTAFVAAVLAAGMPSTALAAGDSLDVAGWLAKPGVKLLAVEFYATWCKPCMEAVPRWEQLRQKYQAEGLRLVVVSTRDPGGACANPGWTPDEIICDPQGRIADDLGAGDTLPAAYLWSWQGQLLVRRRHVEDVEHAVQRWMRQTPCAGRGRVRPHGPRPGPARGATPEREA